MVRANRNHHLSEEEKQAIIADVKEGKLNRNRIAQKHGVDPATVKKWERHYLGTPENINPMPEPAKVANAPNTPTPEPIKSAPEEVEVVRKEDLFDLSPVQNVQAVTESMKASTPASKEFECGQCYQRGVSTELKKGWKTCPVCGLELYWP